MRLFMRIVAGLGRVSSMCGIHHLQTWKSVARTLERIVTNTQEAKASDLLDIVDIAVAGEDLAFEFGHVVVPELGGFTVERACTG